MAIALPSTPWARDAVPRMLAWGGQLKPILGGPTQSILRLGTRFALDVAMPPMEAEPTGRTWVAALLQATAQGDTVLFKWPQLSFNTTGMTDGTLTIARPAGSTTINLTGLAATQQVKVGQFISLRNAATGRRYLHMVTTQKSATAGAINNVGLTPELRADFAAGDVVDIVTPYIEGLLTGNERDWNLDSAHHTGLAFVIEERE